MIKADFIIVGSGLTGSTIARILADDNRDVLIVDRRNHIAGNAFDYEHQSGARIHKYGPHYFRCSSETTWNFVNRFSDFYEWTAELRTRLNGKYFNWPITQAYIEKSVGKELNLFKGNPVNFEDACLAKMPRGAYETFVKGYTEKQWGVECSDLSKELANRITINEAELATLTPKHRWNALPRYGYTEMVRRMIEGIRVKLDFDYLENRNAVIANKLLVFTGPIDEFFNYKYGKLKYRSQNRTVEHLPDLEQYQPYVQVNYPNADERRLRTIEWKHLLPEHDRKKVKGTVLTHETPFTPDHPDQYEYPFPDRINKALCRKYEQEVAALKGVLICGRLGEYRYYDMDQAIERAMNVGWDILKGS